MATTIKGTSSGACRYPLACAALKPLVFEGSVTAGGALVQTTDVENLSGFPTPSWVPS